MCKTVEQLRPEDALGQGSLAAAKLSHKVQNALRGVWDRFWRVLAAGRYLYPPKRSNAL